jgi:hypothetical protein
MLTGKELGQAISVAIERKLAKGAAKSKAEIARHFGVQPPSIHDWIKKGSIDKAKLPELWRYFSDVVPRDHWGLSARETPAVYGDFEPGPDLPEMFRRLPVVGTAQLGPEGFWEETGYPVGRGEGYVEFVSRDPNAYVLRVRGNSMAPTIRNGWLVVVEPNGQIIPGEHVMVCIKDGRCMVKEYLYERNGVVGLGSVNEAFARIELHREEIEKMHAVGATIPPSRMKPW